MDIHVPATPPSAMNIHVLPLNVAPRDSPICHSHGHSPVLPSSKVDSREALSANGHFGVLSSIECCSQQQRYLSMDISVSFHLSQSAPSDSLICPRPSLFAPFYRRPLCFIGLHGPWAQGPPLIITIIDIRTFVPFMVFAWHWKKDSALSLFGGQDGGL
jgi:hypothetical protein